MKASPVARRLAQEAGLDVSRIRGTGPDGRVMERDVQAAAASKQAPPAEPRPAPARQAAPADGETTPLNKIRLATARRMTESKTTAPHFYVTIEVDMDEAVRLREQLNRLAPAGEKISVNDFVVAAAGRTLASFPALNASWRDGYVATHSRVNIGIAVALEDGLVTPVLRDADSKPLKTIAAEARAMAGRAREGKLRSDDIGFGTFTVSNLGMFDVDEFIAIINPPEAAILAIGAVTRRPVAAGETVRIGNVMKATLSVDHRVADGAQAGRYLQEFRKLLENPVNPPGRVAGTVFARPRVSSPCGEPRNPRGGLPRSAPPSRYAEDILAPREAEHAATDTSRGHRAGLLRPLRDGEPPGRRTSRFRSSCRSANRSTHAPPARSSAPRGRRSATTRRSSSRRS